MKRSVIGMDRKGEILGNLRALRHEIAARYKVSEMSVFGSVVRGEEKDTSDLDILADFRDDADLFDLVGLSLFLEEKLGMKTDIVSKSALREELRESVLREAIPI